MQEYSSLNTFIKKQEPRKIFSGSCKIIYLKLKFLMNSKIFNLVQENLNNILKIQATPKTDLIQLDWTDSKRKLFAAQLQRQLGVDMRWFETVGQLVDDLTVKYMDRFFGHNWGHTIDQYVQTGWALVDRVNALNPRSVLDVGCGFNLFKGRIQNLVGLDP